MRLQKLFNLLALAHAYKPVSYAYMLAVGPSQPTAVCKTRAAFVQSFRSQKNVFFFDFPLMFPRIARFDQPESTHILPTPFDTVRMQRALQHTTRRHRARNVIRYHEICFGSVGIYSNDYAKLNCTSILEYCCTYILKAQKNIFTKDAQRRKDQSVAESATPCSFLFELPSSGCRSSLS